MELERARAYLLSLPYVVETQQWGDNLVFWVGDKAIGGKMFALLDFGAGLSKGVAMFSAGPERYAELLERDGMIPAPYMARIHWVAAERWSALRNTEWEEAFAAAHAITLDKLPQRVRETIALPLKPRRKLIAERRKLLAERESAKKKRQVKK